MQLFFKRGSKLFETEDELSDIDVGFVVDDDFDLSAFSHTSEDGYENRIWSDTGYTKVDEKEIPIDVQYVRESDFIDMIREHRIFALEAVFQEDSLSDYKKYFELDKWKLRQEFSAVSSNSWVKAKKKMTVEKDLDMRCGAKSLFHSIRLLMEAVQIARHGRITHYNCGVLLHKEIMDDLKNGFKWEDFKEKYRPVWKEWHHTLIEECPKPVE